MKLGWIAVGGTNPRLIDEALARLELHCGRLSFCQRTGAARREGGRLAARHVPTRAIQARLVANLARLRAMVARTAVTVLDVEGGWYATLRLPAVETEQVWSLVLLERDGVYVHPGYFFDFPDEAYVVLSLLTPEDVFSAGVERLVARVATQIAGKQTRGSAS